jgi:hypothetical protein
MRSFAIVAALLTASAGVAAGQVGHAPSRSPYRDLRWGQFVSVSAGALLGKGGTLGIGPHDGKVIWVRHEFLADRPVSLSLGGGLARSDRNYVDFGAPAAPVKGPVQHDTWFAEGTVQLNLTGGKTWRNLAPYVNGGIGLAFGERLAVDSSGYKFGTRFYLAPGIGTRVFLTRRLYLRVEARALFWSLSYPARYREDPDGITGPLVGVLQGQAIKEWSPAPAIHAGLGYAFRRPFF